MYVYRCMEKIINFNKLITEYTKPVFQYIYAHVHEFDLAEDLTQQTFFKVWKCKSNMDFQTSVLPYLYKTALNEIRLYIRSSETIVPTPDGLEIVDPATIRNPEKDQTSLLLEELAKLSDHERELITIRYIDQMDLAEASHITGKTIIATRVSIYRALQKLKAKILEAKSGENK
jgi:RNA polymerase sigma-70 factor (ECF subfamily)